MHDYAPALQGGVLIGLASWVLLAGVGRASGVSAIAADVLTTRKHRSHWRWAFLFGLVAGGALFAWLLRVPSVDMRSSLVLIPAGFMVGFGAVLGSGSVSGHAVCGLGRRSRRSLAAVVTFAGAGVATVMVASHLPAATWWAEVIFEGLRWLVGR